MNRFLPILATIEMSENDKRALIALVIILVILFVLIGLLGMAVRKTMEYQGKRADTLMHDVTITKVVTTPLQFRVLGRKKNHRLLYRQSLWPFLVALTGLIIWIIASLATRNWTENIFADFGDLFFPSIGMLKASGPAYSDSPSSPNSLRSAKILILFLNISPPTLR